ncbi:MAG: hypothetical protein GC147_11085 [Porphyrobacter sp.]|nr:hypothetical protein [Porphyrobacter sp.]
MTCRPRCLAPLLTLALAGCAPAGGAPAGGAPANEGKPPADPALAGLLGEADRAIAEGRLPEAERLIEQARRIDKDSSDLWVATARLRFRGGQHLAALDAADRALALGPDHAPALLMRALMVRDAHGLAPSLPWFEAALAAGDGEARTRADAWAEYAATLGDAGNNRAMLAAVRELAAIAPHDPRVFYLQAVLAGRAERSVLARSLLDRSGMAARGVPAALLLDALLDLQEGNNASAAQTLEGLVQRQPANPRLRELLARAMLLGGREAEVVERFAAEAARPEASPYLAVLVGRAYERLGQRAAAAPLLERGYAAPSQAPVQLAVRPGLPQPTAALRALAADPIAQRAAAQADRARFPQSADFAQLAGDAALAAGDPRAALEAYASATRVRRPWSLTAKAVFAYERAGDGEAAETLLARHVAGEPDNISALGALARVLARRGDTGRAALLLDHAIALGGGHDPALLRWRAEIARVRGDEAAAGRFAALADELHPRPLAGRR